MTATKTQNINCRISLRILPEAANVSEAVRDILTNAMASDIAPCSFSKVRGEATQPVTIRVTDEMLLWLASFQGKRTDIVSGFLAGKMAGV